MSISAANDGDEGGGRAARMGRGDGLLSSNPDSLSNIIVNIWETFCPEKFRFIRSLPHIRQKRFSRRRPLSRTSRLIV